MRLIVLMGRNEFANKNIFVTASLLLIGACTSGSDGPAQADSTTIPPSGNSSPTISGMPPSSVIVGQSYEFTPSASDPDSDPLTFSVDKLPSWAIFDSATGTMSGVPQAGDEGDYKDIQISVGDGEATVSLPNFEVTVTQMGTGSVTLSWTIPTENSDGSPLTDLTGYKFYYGTSPGSYTNVVTVNNPGLSSYVIDSLAPNTYFFVATATNSGGLESQFSIEDSADVM